MKLIIFLICLFILFRIVPAQQVKPVENKLEIKRKISVFPGIINDQMLSEDGYHTLHFKIGQHEYIVKMTDEGLANFEYNTLFNECSEEGKCKLMKS